MTHMITLDYTPPRRHSQFSDQPSTILTIFIKGCKVYVIRFQTACPTAEYSKLTPPILLKRHPLMELSGHIKVPGRVRVTGSSFESYRNLPSVHVHKNKVSWSLSISQRRVLVTKTNCFSRPMSYSDGQKYQSSFSSYGSAEKIGQEINFHEVFFLLSTKPYPKKRIARKYISRY